MQHPPLISSSFIPSGRRKIRLLKSLPPTLVANPNPSKRLASRIAWPESGMAIVGQGTGRMFDRRGEQPERRQGKALSTRRIVAGALAIFVILQGLFTIGSAVGRFAHRSETSLVVSLLGVTCAVNAPEPGRPPAHEHSPTQCCVFCGARDLTNAALPAVAPRSETLTPPSARASIERLRGETPVDRPIGWGSSWSSRAPPLFS